MEIRTSQSAYQVLKKYVTNDVEEFWVMALNSTKQMIKIQMIFRGTVDFCFIHPRDVFRFAILQNASSILLAHNHPSGEVLPSKQDIIITQDLILIGKLLQIPIVDHIILCKSGYKSLFDENLVQFNGLKSLSN